MRIFLQPLDGWLSHLVIVSYAAATGRVRRHKRINVACRLHHTCDAASLDTFFHLCTSDSLRLQFFSRLKVIRTEVYACLITGHPCRTTKFLYLEEGRRRAITFGGNIISQKMLLAVEIFLARVVQIQISQTTEPNQSESSPRPNNLRMMICKKPTEPVLPNILIAAAPPKLDTLTSRW